MTMLIEIAVKASAIFLLVLAALPLLRRQSAALRHWVLAVAVVGAALVPALQLIAPTWHLPFETVRISSEVPVARVTGSTPASAAETSAQAAAVVTEAPSGNAPFDAVAIVVAVWLGGALMAFAVLAVGLLRLAWLASAARAMTGQIWIDTLDEVRRELGIARTVRLMVSRHPSLLVTWGLSEAKVMVPDAAREWPRERIRLVLRHELAHVRRGDWMVQLLAEGVRAIYWFNPLAWIVCARLRQDSEQSCDDLVITCGVEGADYATHLVEIARDLQPPAVWIPAPAIARASSLERRVRAMLDRRLDRRPLSRRMRTICALSVLILTLAIASAAARQFASLAGSIIDPGNGFLPGVTLVLINEQTQAKYELRSDPTGRYEFVGLPAGRYTLEAVLPGFQTFRSSIVIAGQNLQQDMTLQVGTVRETVTVRGGPGPSEPPSAPDPEKERQLQERIQKRAQEKCPEAPKSTGPAMGGNLRVPWKLKDMRPVYPAQQAGAVGKVELQGRIGLDGVLRDLDIVSSTHPDFTASALAAVGEWRFDATLLNCVAVETPIQITVNYEYQP